MTSQELFRVVPSEEPSRNSLDELAKLRRELRLLRRSTERLFWINGIVFGAGLGLALLMVARMFA